MNSPWYNKWLVYLTLTSHQAIITQSFLPPPAKSIYLTFLKEVLRDLYCHVTQKVRRANRSNMSFNSVNVKKVTVY